MRNFNDESGFTLVELMVVVAIIGILSAVAIPNFKRYQAKSKTTEAKVNLASVYTVQMSHYTDTDLYSHCLEGIGYVPGGYVDAVNDGSAQRYYTVGFSGEHDIGGVPPANCGAFQFIGLKGGQAAAAVLPANTINNGAGIRTFTAGAAGVIQQGSNPDQWTVNQDKTIVHAQRGF